MKIGYARVSTSDQKIDLQIDALQRAGCEKIYSDVMSGTTALRPNLLKIKQEILRPGDDLVVWKMDRLGRSVKDLIEWMDYFKLNKINFISLHENIDTSSPSGMAFFHLIAVFTEFEHSIFKERSKAGMEAARARGKVGGRPRVPIEKLEHAKYLYDKKTYSLQQISEISQVSVPKFYSYLKSLKSMEVKA